MSADDNPNPVTLDKSDSYLFGIFNGKVQHKHIFPYPKVFNQEEVDELQMFFDSAKSAFEENNDGLGKLPCLKGRLQLMLDYTTSQSERVDLGCPSERFLAINSGEAADFLQAY